MIERAKNAWGTFRLAMNGQGNTPVQLDEVGEEQLKGMLKGLAEVGFKIDEMETAQWRRIVARGQHTDALLENPAIEIEEVVRQDRENDWRNQVCQNQKSIRSHFCVVVSLALISLIFQMLGLFGLSKFSLLILAIFAAILLMELNACAPDKEYEEVRSQALAARRAGDREAATLICMSYHDK